MGGLNLWRNDKGSALYRLIPKIGGPAVLSVVRHYRAAGLDIGTSDPQGLAEGIRDFLLAANDQLAQQDEILCVMSLELATTQELVPLETCVSVILGPLLTSVPRGSRFTVQLEFAWLLLELLHRGPGIVAVPRLKAEDPCARIHELLDALWDGEPEGSETREALDELFDALNEDEV